MIDRGGYESNWKQYFDDMFCFQHELHAQIPGNHEYYQTSDGTYVNPDFFNLFTNNPQNGPKERLNSTYYFKYGQALIIMLDTIDKKFYKEQKAWFKDVIANNPSQWIIVGTHAGFFSCGSYDSDAKWMSNHWKKTFEECQVDLVLSGHEHVYIRKDHEYQNTTNEELGTTYLVSPAMGTKQYPKQDKPGLITKRSQNAGNVITITDDELKVETFGRDIVTDSMKKIEEFTLKPKRPRNITPMNDEDILNSIKLDYDEENQKGKIIWDKNLYGNVKSIAITTKFDNVEDTKLVNVSSANLNYKEYDPLFKSTNYTFDLVINKQDGTTLNKTLNLVNYIESKIISELNGGQCDKMLPTMYVEGHVLGLPVPTKDKAVFKGWYLTPDFSGDPITEIGADFTGDVHIYAKWANISTIEYELNEGTLDNPVTEYVEGDGVELPTPTREKGEFQGWYLNPDFSGEAITRIDENQVGNIKLYAKWKTGCSCKKNSVVIELLTAVTLLAFALRIKK